MQADKIVKKIIKTYVGRLDELSFPKARHFLYRAFKATNKQDLYRLLVKKCLPETEKRKQKITDCYLNDYDSFLKERQKGIENYKAVKINDQKKKEEWLRHISLPVLSASVLRELHYARIFGLGGGVFEEVSEFVKEKGILDELLESPDFIKYAATCATNIVYFGRNLGLFDIEKEFIKVFKKAFDKKEFIKDNVVFTNFVYGLTHIIIGDSAFYQKPLDKDKYFWVFKDFKKYGKDIFSRLSLDINVEVALCLRFFGRENGFVKRVVERLIRNFDKEKGYIQREKRNSFSFAEHTNAVALLLFRVAALRAPRRGRRWRK